MSELLNGLRTRFGDLPIAANSKSAVDDGAWTSCGVCKRTAVELAVLNKKGEILCCPHRHHDHIADYFRSKFDGLSICRCWGEWIYDASPALSRFRDRQICSFCNEAEGNAKKSAKTDKWFSFTPDELTRIVRVEGPGPVGVDKHLAMEIWESLKSNLVRRMKIADRLFELAKAGDLGPSGHPMRPTRPDEPKNFRDLKCDGSYHQNQLAKRMGLT